jgi:hypothetical protein
VAQYLGSLLGLRGLLRNRAAPGSAPGTLLVDPEAKPTQVRVFCFGPSEFEEHQLAGRPGTCRSSSGDSATSGLWA